MILLIDSNEDRKKKLCGIMNKERIVLANNYQEALKKLVFFKSQISIIISSLLSLNQLISKEVLDKLCYRFNINKPPILGFYGKEEERHAKFKEALKNCEAKSCLIKKYDPNNSNFPLEWFAFVSQVYKNLRYDGNYAFKVWYEEVTKTDENELEEVRRFIENLEVKKENLENKLKKEESNPEPMDITKIINKKDEKQITIQEKYNKLKKEYEDLRKKYARLEEENNNLQDIINKYREVEKLKKELEKQ